MSRVIYVILFLYAVSFEATAQKRVCDLTAEIIYPKAGHIFKSPDYDSVRINVINLGPDSLIPTDVYSIQIHFGGHHRFPKYGSFNQYVPPNSKFAYAEKFEVNYAGNVDSFNLCVEVYAVHKPGTDSLQYEKNISYENNKVCTTVEHRDSTYVGIPQHELDKTSVFPNPSKGEVTVRSISEVREIEVFTLLGQIVSDQSISVDISENNREARLLGLSSGMYLIRIYTDEGFSTHRLIVQND